MAVASESGSPAKSTPEGPASGRARGGAPLRWLVRLLALREGSIIVVTLVTIIYFAITTNNFLTFDNFKSLLPYFCFLAIMAAGQVFVMTLGEIDLSIGALYLFTPFFFWKLNTGVGLPLGLAMIVALLLAAVLRRRQRPLHRLGRDPLVRGDAGDAVLPRRPVADPLAL